MKSSSRFMLAILIVAIIGIGWYLSNQKDNSSKPTQNKIHIVTTFYPLADFAKQVGGDLVDVTNITPAGAEPHDYEPTPRDLAAVYGSQLFLLNGNGVDAWAEKIMPDLIAKKISVIKMSDHIESLKADASSTEEGAYDPHVWLDPNNAITEADLIAAALAKLDPEHAGTYEANRGAFKNQLTQLDQEYRAGLTSCKLHEIVVSHNAFRYLAKRYNLTSYFIDGLTPDEEPTPDRIASIATLAKQKGIKYIFFETLVSPKIANTIAAEIGAQTLVLNPIEGLIADELAAGKNYVKIMEENLSHLKQALQCQ